MTNTASVTFNGRTYTDAGMTRHERQIFDRMAEGAEICELRRDLGRQCADCVLLGGECLEMHKYFKQDAPARNEGKSREFVSLTKQA